MSEVAVVRDGSGGSLCFGKPADSSTRVHNIHNMMAPNGERKRRLWVAHKDHKPLHNSLSSVPSAPLPPLSLLCPVLPCSPPCLLALPSGDQVINNNKCRVGGSTRVHPARRALGASGRHRSPPSEGAWWRRTRAGVTTGAPPLRWRRCLGPGLAHHPHNALPLAPPACRGPLVEEQPRRTCICFTLHSLGVVCLPVSGVSIGGWARRT